MGIVVVVGVGLGELLLLVEHVQVAVPLCFIGVGVGVHHQQQHRTATSARDHTRATAGGFRPWFSFEWSGELDEDEIEISRHWFLDAMPSPWPPTARAAPAAAVDVP